MGRPKGGKNKFWSTEEKLRIVLRVEAAEKPHREIAKEENVYARLLWTWVMKYREKGIEGITNKRKPGNPLMKYQRRKTLTEMEKLEYENMKLKIENARLKKGYTEKEVMATRQEKSSKKNMQ